MDTIYLPCIVENIHRIAKTAVEQHRHRDRYAAVVAVTDPAGDPDDRRLMLAVQCLDPVAMATRMVTIAAAYPPEVRDAVTRLDWWPRDVVALDGDGAGDTTWLFVVAWPELTAPDTVTKRYS